MANSIDECTDSIIQAIDNLFDAKSESLKYDKTYRGKVLNIIDENKYEVSVNGALYELLYNGTLNIGDIVRIKSPMNNFSEIYIEPVASSGGGAETTTNYNELQNKPILDTTSEESLDGEVETIQRNCKLTQNF